MFCNDQSHKYLLLFTVSVHSLMFCGDQSHKYLLLITVTIYDPTRFLLCLHSASTKHGNRYQPLVTKSKVMVCFLLPSLPEHSSRT